ncbi:MAG: hypothetical protein Q8929_12580 [Bacillota bacterium]|nr:hypothetical protein [Bacillota bacterium]
MRMEISGFIQKDQFDLNSYLTYLFGKLHDSKVENKKILRLRGGKRQSDWK